MGEKGRTKLVAVAVALLLDRVAAVVARRLAAGRVGLRRLSEVDGHMNRRGLSSTANVHHPHARIDQLHSLTPAKGVQGSAAVDNLLSVHWLLTEVDDDRLAVRLTCDSDVSGMAGRSAQGCLRVRARGVDGLRRRRKGQVDVERAEGLDGRERAASRTSDQHTVLLLRTSTRTRQTSTARMRCVR